MLGTIRKRPHPENIRLEQQRSKKAANRSKHCKKKYETE